MKDRLQITGDDRGEEERRSALRQGWKRGGRNLRMKRGDGGIQMANLLRWALITNEGQMTAGVL